MSAFVIRDLSQEAARMASAGTVMDAVAVEVMASVARYAAPHVDTGSFISRMAIRHVPGKKGVVDRVVESYDPAALSIEFGHLTKGRRVRRVPAQRVMGRAARIG